MNLHRFEFGHIASPGLVRAPYSRVIDAAPYPIFCNVLIGERRNGRSKITAASPGPGTVHHIALETLKRAANVNMTYVPYPATPPALNALLGGHVDAVFSDLASMSSQLKAGTVRALVTTSERRIATLPDVPTAAEAGFKGFDVETWFGITAPPKTPGHTTAELIAWFSAAQRSDVVRQKLAAQGFGVTERCGAEFSSLLRQSHEWIEQMVRNANMKVE